MSAPHRLLKAARLIHLYLGVYITPALIFFAFTGFIQTFSLHETTRGSDYKPPKILEQLGQLHKKQTLILPTRRPEALPSGAPKQPQPGTAAVPLQQDAATKRPDAPSQPSVAKKQNLLPMKLFFALVSVGLLTSTLTGLYMSYKFVRNKPLITATLIAGIVIPVLLTFL